MTCAGVALLLAIVCQRRVFFGEPVAMNIVNFDDLFYAGQWGAVLFSVVSLTLSVIAFRDGARGTSAMAVPAVALLLLVYCVATGIPHKANKGSWRNGELGLAAFRRGMAITRKANAPPIHLTADAFAGSWRALDGTVYAIANDRISWSANGKSGEYSTAACGADFQIEFLQRERDALQDYGLVWSVHAGATSDSTAADAKIPVAYCSCGPHLDRLTFIRATPDEVWRLTDMLRSPDLQSESFVLRRVTP